MAKAKAGNALTPQLLGRRSWEIRAPTQATDDKTIDQLCLPCLRPKAVQRVKARSLNQKSASDIFGHGGGINSQNLVKTLSVFLTSAAKFAGFPSGQKSNRLNFGQF